MGKAFFIVHHAGKGGNQLGTSGREVILSTNIRLEAPEDHEASDGTQFKVSYDKARLFNGADAASFEASFNGTGWNMKNLSAEKTSIYMGFKVSVMFQGYGTGGTKSVPSPLDFFDQVEHYFYLYFRS